MNDPFERAVQRERLERRERQTRHVSAGFRVHATIFVVVNVALVLLWVVEQALDDGAGWHDPWFVPVLGIWGLVLLLHGWNVWAHHRRDAALRTRLDGTGSTP